MVKSNKLIVMLIALFSFVVILGACSDKESDSESNSNTNSEETNDDATQETEDKEDLEEDPATEDIDFKMEDIWMTPTKTGEDAKVYMTLNNESDEQVDLHDAMIIGVSYSVSFFDGEEEFTGGYIEIPAGETLQLTSDDIHMVFENIEEDMNAGDTFTLSLHLTPYGDVNVEGVVEDR